jgi:serine protease Do
MPRFLAACFLGIFLSGCLAIQSKEDVLLNPRESGKAFTAITRQASPSVVSVQTEAPIDPAAMKLSPLDEELLKHFFGDLPKAPSFDDIPPDERFTTAQGSGFIFRVEGGHSYILTTYHVIEGASTIRVMLLDGKEFVATIKGVDPQSDIAALEIPTSNARPLPLGNSDRLDVGEWVLAIGNPFGLQHTLTVGVISATGRSDLGINTYEDFIQTDAAINPGNSGGPMLNIDGKVVGMNSAIISSSGNYMGIGFAIPINFVKTVADQLMQQGSVVRGQIGVLLEPLTHHLATSLKLDASQTGVVVSDVQPKTPAAKAGIQKDDVIISFAGKPVLDVGEFRNQVAATSPGSQREIGILRHGEHKTLNVDISQLAP